MKTEIGEPPYDLEPNELLAKVISSRGALWDVKAAQAHVEKHALGSADLLVQLSPVLQRKFFVRRGGYVIVSLLPLEEREKGKVTGEITNIVADQRQWQKMPYWPEEFKTVQASSALDLPPSLSDEEEEYDYGQ